MTSWHRTRVTVMMLNFFMSWRHGGMAANEALHHDQVYAYRRHDVVSRCCRESCWRLRLISSWREVMAYIGRDCVTMTCLNKLTAWAPTIIMYVMPYATTARLQMIRLGRANDANASNFVWHRQWRWWLFSTLGSLLMFSFGSSSICTGYQNSGFEYLHAIIVPS